MILHVPSAKRRQKSYRNSSKRVAGLVTITIVSVSGVGLALRANPACDRYKVRHMTLDVALEDDVVVEHDRFFMHRNPKFLVGD